MLISEMECFIPLAAYSTALSLDHHHLPFWVRTPRAHWPCLQSYCLKWEFSCATYKEACNNDMLLQTDTSLILSKPGLHARLAYRQNFAETSIQYLILNKGCQEICGKSKGARSVVVIFQTVKSRHFSSKKGRLLHQTVDETQYENHFHQTCHISVKRNTGVAIKTGLSNVPDGRRLYMGSEERWRTFHFSVRFW